MSESHAPGPVQSPAAWRRAELATTDEWIHVLSPAEVDAIYAFGYLRACRADVAMCRVAGQRTRQSADDEHEAGRPERARLVERAPVVVAHGLPRGGIGVGEHAAAAVARERQAMRFDRAHGGREPRGGDLIAPRRDRTDAA